MRLRPLDPSCFPSFGILDVVVYGFQLILLVFVIGIVIPEAVQPGNGSMIEDKIDRDGKLARGAVRANRPTATELDRCAPVLRQELAKYKRTVIQVIG